MRLPNNYTMPSKGVVVGVSVALGAVLLGGAGVGVWLLVRSKGTKPPPPPVECDTPVFVNVSNACVPNPTNRLAADTTVFAKDSLPAKMLAVLAAPGGTRITGTFAGNPVESWAGPIYAPAGFMVSNTFDETMAVKQAGWAVDGDAIVTSASGQYPPDPNSDVSLTYISDTSATLTNGGQSTTVTLQHSAAPV